MEAADPAADVLASGNHLTTSQNQVLVESQRTSSIVVLHMKVIRSLSFIQNLDIIPTNSVVSN